MLRVSRLQAISGAGSLLLFPRRARAQGAAKITFCGVPTYDLIPVLWAIGNGAYEKAGLSLDFAPTSSGAASTTAVIAGSYDMGKGSVIASCAAHLKNVPIAFVGNAALWETENPWSLGIVAADATIQTGSDLNGQTVGVTALNDLGTLAIKVWVDKNGGDSKTLKFVEIPNSAAAAAVADHRIATFQLEEPGLTAALATSKVKALAPFLGAIGPSYVLTNYFARPEWIRAHRSAVDTFVRVTYESAVFTNTHPADTAPLVSQITKIPLDVVQKMRRARSATTSDPALIQPVIDAAARYGQLSRTFPAKEMYF